MMITMHSILKDRYRRRSIILDSMVFSTSVLIAALAFGDRSIVDWLPFTTESVRPVIGIVAVCAFLGSLTSWLVDWKGKADAHDRAASAYTRVKFHLNPGDATRGDQELEQDLLLYEEVARNAVSVPDSMFLRLKAEHLMKVRLSRILDRSPGASLFWLKILLRLRHTRRAAGNSESNT